MDECYQNIHETHYLFSGPVRIKKLDGLLILFFIYSNIRLQIETI
jgi:hypothetical protein